METTNFNTFDIRNTVNLINSLKDEVAANGRIDFFGENVYSELQPQYDAVITEPVKILETPLNEYLTYQLTSNISEASSGNTAVIRVFIDGVYFGQLTCVNDNSDTMIINTKMPAVLTCFYIPKEGLSPNEITTASVGISLLSMSRIFFNMNKILITTTNRSLIPSSETSYEETIPDRYKPSSLYTIAMASAWPQIGSRLYEFIDLFSQTFYAFQNILYYTYTYKGEEPIRIPNPDPAPGWRAYSYIVNPSNIDQTGNFVSVGGERFAILTQKPVLDDTIVAIWARLNYSVSFDTTAALYDLGKRAYSNFFGLSGNSSVERIQSGAFNVSTPVLCITTNGEPVFYDAVINGSCTFMFCLRN